MTIYDHEPDCNCVACKPPNRKQKYWRVCGWLDFYGCDRNTRCFWTTKCLQPYEYCRKKSRKFIVSDCCMWRE